ncbi:molybdopterin-dependent oxidoreductase [uncultured Celeribacter sp.]|uniref:molybdopterin-dependent oxidoreductase n=1 Tax=uncultured Celeribacter sp. TaxID=1303376 RepID=UPI002AA61DB0|nr:molybdopterin-dependent oxidoreductase [uncultured Celeribacter sp.]
MTGYIQNASHWGTFEARHSEGNLDVRPAPNDPHPSPMLGNIDAMVHGPQRLRRPLIRRAFLDGDFEAARAARGGDDFVPVSWDTALEITARELARVRDTHGNEAIFGGSYGWASAGRFHHARTQLQRFLGQFGGYTTQEQNYSYATAITFLPHVLGDIDTVQGPVSSLDGIAKHTGLLLNFGGISPGNMQVEAGGMGQHSGLGWLATCRKSGMEMLNISPTDQELPGEGDPIPWLPIRPGTDTALLLAMCYTLLDEGLAELDFVARYCIGGAQVMAYLRGASDGIAKTPDWASAICDIPAERIADLARKCAKTRCFLTMSWSVQRADHGEQPMWALITFAALLGQIGLPGGGLAIGLWSLSGMGNPRPALPSPALRPGPNPVKACIPVARISDMLLNPGATYPFNGETRTYPDIRLVYWCGGNPFHHHQDLAKLTRAFRRPEVVIVQEIAMTATARHADIVLPATTTLERNDIASSSRDRFITAMYRVLPPVGEARDDHAIFADLAERLGFADAFTEGRDEMAWLRSIYEVARETGATRDLHLPDFDTFWRDGQIELPTPEEPYVQFSAFRADPEGAPLKTPSGKIELYSKAIAAMGYDDCPGHVTWLPPREWLGAEAAQTGPEALRPLHMLSLQPATRLHSQMDPGPVSQSAKINGAEPCLIHPEDAILRNIQNGDLVELFNARGRCLAGARLSERVMRGVIVLPTGAWYRPEARKDREGREGRDMSGNPNTLTEDRGSSKLTQAPIPQTTLVFVRRYDIPDEPSTQS